MLRGNVTYLLDPLTSTFSPRLSLPLTLSLSLSSSPLFLEPPRSWKVCGRRLVHKLSLTKARTMAAESFAADRGERGLGGEEGWRHPFDRRD